MTSKLGKYHCIVVGDNETYHKTILNNKEITSSSKESKEKNIMHSFRQSSCTLISHVTPHCKNAGQNFEISHLVHAQNIPRN